MKNALHPNGEPLYASKAVEAEVLFVDLDETFLDGTVTSLSDEELLTCPLICETLDLIHQAKAMGIPVVLVTRNNEEGIERFFRTRPQLRDLFDELIACETGGKSDPIKTYMESRRIDPQKALFLDDTLGERDEVKMNAKGVQAFNPDNVRQLNLKRVPVEEAEDVQNTTRGKLLKRFKETPYPEERKQIKIILQSRFHMEAYEINLAA